MINIPGYSVSGEIGRGGMAVVHRARQVLLDREVALKVLNPQLAQDPVYAQRFLQEARMLASLGHPHIVPVYDVGVTPEGVHYFSMQMLVGGDFGRKLREGIDEVELVRVLLAVAQALGFAHSRGYVHRDVTPANILFDERNRPVLTDFGIARALASTSRITASGLSVGTSHYMSPEQARGHEVDRRSDIYSLGVLVYEALAGKPPFDGDDGFAVAYAHVHEPVPRLPEEISRWQPLIDRAMAKVPEERYSDSAEFIEGLRATAPAEFAQVLKKDGVVMTPPASPAPTRADAKAAKASAAAKPAVAPAPVAKPAQAPERKRVANGSGGGSRAPLFIGLGLVVAGALLLGGWFFFGRESTVPPAANVSAPPIDARKPPSPTTATPPVSVPLEPTAETPAAGPDPALEPVAEWTPAADLLASGEIVTVEDPVIKLLGMGRANLAAQRLTSPPVGNALDRYLLALTIEPGNKDAIAGVASVAQAYVDLAAKQDREAALDTWLEYLDRAEGIAREHKASAPLAAATALRKAYADELVARGAKAASEWRRDEAMSVFERALRVLPGSEAAQRGLREADSVGKPGYVFRDLPVASSAPEMIVVGQVAMARGEVTVAQFRAFWNAAGRQQFGAAPPSCRDRESFFRASKKRTWEAPGFEQGDSHPVVCVSYPMAEAYARWLSQASDKPYRLPTAAEWRGMGSVGVPTACSANVKDAEFRKTFGGRAGLECSDGFAATAPVRRFAARKPGLYDTDGNVREWVSDCGGGNCREHLALGASWFSEQGDPPAPAFGADTAFNTIGFRVLRELE